MLLAVLAASINHPLIRSEERSRRYDGSRRLRAGFTYGFVVLALGLALSDFCRLMLAPGSNPAVLVGQQR